MEIISKINDEALKISLVGELDANGAINLDNIIKKAIADSYYNIIIDCQQLTYISSAGLGVFISHIEDLKEKQGKFVFCNMNSNVMNVFKLLGLQNVMSIADDVAEAKKALDEN